MTKKVAPVSPSDIRKSLGDIIPGFVVQAVNNLLKQKYRGQYPITLKQCDVISEILTLAPDNFDEKDLFIKKYLDFESLFERSGWSVSYNGQGFNESFEPTYKFKPKTKQ